MLLGDHYSWKEEKLYKKNLSLYVFHSFNWKSDVQQKWTDSNLRNTEVKFIKIQDTWFEIFPVWTGNLIHHFIEWEVVSTNPSSLL